MRQILKDLQDMFIQRKKFIIIFLIALFGVCISGMIISIFVDLSLSQLLNNPSQWFSKLMAQYGEWPAYAINAGVPAALFALLIKNKKYLRSFPPLIFACIFGYFFSTRRFDVSTWFTIVTLTIMCLFFFLVKKEVLEKLVYLGCLAFIISNTAYLVMLLFKYTWGRVRFNDLTGNFTPWYRINGPNGNESFFSGHVQSAYSLAFLWFAPCIFKIKNIIARVLLAAFPAFYTIAMIYSRIVNGAHYLSDGIFAIINLNVWAVIIMYLMFRFYKEMKNS